MKLGMTGRIAASRSLYLLSASSAVLLLAGGRVHAQEAVAEPEELPPIVVEGATIEKPKVRVKTTPTSRAAGKVPGPVQPTSPGEVVKATGGAAAESGGEPVGASETVSTTGVAADEIGSAVTIVTGAQLKAQQIRHAADALRSLPGVSVSRTGGFGGLTQVRIRGAEGNHTLVLIDGVEANDTTNGEFDFSDLSADEIEQIEVIRGGYSGVYGSGAIGGVINITTRRGKGPLTFAGYAEGGAFETKAGGLRVSAGNDNIWGSISFSRRETDGFNIARFGDETDGNRLANFTFNGGAQILPGLVLDLSMRRAEKQGDRDAQDYFPSITGIQVDDPANYQTVLWLGAAKLTYDSPDGMFTHSVKATRNVTDRDDNDPLGNFFVVNEGERKNYSYTGTVRTPGRTFLESRHAITGLVEWEEESFTPNTNSTDPFFGFPGDGRVREESRRAYAGEYRADFFDRLFVTGAIREDEYEAFDAFTTWRATATLKIPELGLRPHASIGTGVKAPTMFERYGLIPNSFTPNPDLLPEESEGWDAGVELSVLRGAVVVDVTYFEQDLTNKIFGLAPGPNFTFTAINLPGVAKRDGIEVASRITLSPELSFGASYTYLDARDVNDVEEIRRPPHSGRIDANYSFAGGRGNFNVAAVYNGDMLDLNLGPPNAGLPAQLVLLDEYWLVTAAASYEVTPGVELFGRVENLLDQDYEEVFGFETAGAAAYGGVRFRFVEPQSIAWSKGK